MNMDKDNIVVWPGQGLDEPPPCVNSVPHILEVMQQELTRRLFVDADWQRLPRYYAWTLRARRPETIGGLFCLPSVRFADQN